MPDERALSVSLDNILVQLGPFGKYNLVNFALLLFPIYLEGMYCSVFVFEALDINYRCAVPECESFNTSLWLPYAIPIEHDNIPAKCEKYRFRNNTTDGICNAESFDTTVAEKCDSFVYSDEDSAVKDFNLGCQNWKRTLIGSIRNAGLFISLPVTGIISDKYGRRFALSVSCLTNGIFGFLRSFSPSYVVMVTLEFLDTALGAGAYTTAFVLAMESVEPKLRVFGNTLLSTVFVLGLMALAGLSWWLQDWRVMLRIIYIPSCLVFSYIWIMDESVRWLLSKGRVIEAIKVLKKAARMNKIEIPEHLFTTLNQYNTLAIVNDTVKFDKNQESTSAKKQPKILKVFKSNIIRNRLFICSFLWITCTFVYYGLSINAVSLAGNQYLNFMLVGFVEIPAFFACLLVLDRFGRKITLIVTFILSACFCIGLSFLPEDLNTWKLIMYLTGKFAITVAYTTVYIYVSEVFPTNVRQFLLAICSMFGRIGSTLAPLTPLLEFYYSSLPSIFFGIMALIASVMVFSLPETINMTLPDTIEDAERLSMPTTSKQT